MAAIPTTEPSVITAGDSVAWRIDLADYPAGDGWALAYRLINADANIDIASSADGDVHAVSVSAATTATWTAGEYQWVSFVTGGSSERYTLETGQITIKPDLAAIVGAYDTRTSTEKTLETLRTLLHSYLTTSGHINETEVDGTRVRFNSADDIRKRIALLELEVAKEKQAAALASGLPTKNRVFVRFR